MRIHLLSFPIWEKTAELREKSFIQRQKTVLYIAKPRLDVPFVDGVGDEIDQLSKYGYQLGGIIEIFDILNTRPLARV